MSDPIVDFLPGTSWPAVLFVAPLLILSWLRPIWLRLLRDKMERRRWDQVTQLAAAYGPDVIETLAVLACASHPACREVDAGLGPPPR